MSQRLCIPRYYLRKHSLFKRYYADCGTASDKTGLVLGAYESCNPKDDYTLTSAAEQFDIKVNGKLKELLKGTRIKRTKAITFGNVGDDYYHVAVTNLGHESAGMNEKEGVDEKKENIRTAAGVGAMALHNQGITKITVEDFGDPEAAAEGSNLGIWMYQDWKRKEDRIPPAKVELMPGSRDKDAWMKGEIKAYAQNLVRTLEETPSNLMTPLLACQFVAEKLCPCGIDTNFYDRSWLSNNNFHGFLQLSKGSCEPPAILFLQYCGAKKDEKPIVLIGNGVTFSSGGLHLRKCRGMSVHRADLAGAGVIVGVIRAAAQLSLPINIIGMLAVYENMTSSSAVKPGDIVMSRNGKSIRIDQTNSQGRVIMGDILSYTDFFNPCLVVNLCVSEEWMKRAMGNAASGVFSTSDILWWEIQKAGAISGDRMWRFPFWKFFRNRVTNFPSFDLDNVGKGPGGYPCLGAAYLLEFLPPNLDFMHIDISSTGLCSDGITMPYLKKGFMSGRPTRGITQFLYQIACPHND